MRKLSLMKSLFLIVCFTLFLGGLASVGIAADEHAADTDAAHAGEAADDHGDGETGHGDDHAQGVPMSLKEDLAIWSLVTFLVFIFVLKTFAWGPLATGLDKRESSIKNDIAEAEAARVKAEQMLAEHAAKLEKVQEEVRDILAEARRDAETTKNDIIAAAQSEAEATKERSLQEIERARVEALTDIMTKMADGVAQATEQVLGRALEKDDQNRFIEEALAQISEE